VPAWAAWGVVLFALRFAHAAEPPPRHQVDASARYAAVNEGLADTAGVSLRGVRSHQGSAWLGDVTFLDRFDDSGTQFTIGHSREFGPDWLANGSVAASAGGFFWPRVRADVRVGRRWLAARNLVTWIGAGYYDAKDEHEDVGLSLDAAYYFVQPWIVMAGVRGNESYPGSITSVSGFIAATHGRDRQRYVTLRYGGGRQAYDPIVPGAAIVDVPFHQVTLTWRQWMTPRWGFNLVIDGSTSDTYDQAGLEFGLFADF
jgi:YaiO family outer membrane protein